ncbi:hypothetical protein K440DRAFT_68455 [Wilcoxina mikolae CBS 423.85]|nr:hypothetical protein K440DRAFT_68455 [Wilcoxina mikolae CBS 423.85]
MYISPSPPRRSGTRGSFRQGFRGITQDVREGLHDVGQTIKRRMSSGVGDGGRGKKPKINRTLSKMANKAANKANEMFGKYTPRPSESDSAARDMNYHEYQHSSNISPESRQESQVMVTDESYLYQSTMQQMHQQPHENAWSMDMTTDCEPSPSKAMASSSTTPSYGWVQGIGTSSYPLEDWQQQRTAASISLEASPINPRNRDALLGRLSVTPPPDPRFVHGPWQDLHQLSGSRLSGTHKDRFNNTVRKANELTAVVTGDLNSHGQPLSNNVSPTTKDAAAFPLSSATTPSPGPTGKGKHKEESIHYRDDELDATSSENDEDDDGDGDGDNTEKPCPWPNCAGTTKSKAFQPNRLKEHIRRGHLMPFMCDSPGCGVRKGDKNQIYRHRAAKHPDEPKKRCKEQDQDPIAQKKYRALNERSLSYDRITDICRATTIAELEEPWERAARASSSNLVKTESPLSPTGAFEPGLGLSSNIFNQTSGPSSANSTPFPDIITSSFGTNAAPSPATHYPGFMNSCQDGSLPLDDAIMNFVKDVLVPAVDKMSLQSPSSSNPIPTCLASAAPLTLRTRMSPRR